jgi:hypothetical protein
LIGQADGGQMAGKIFLSYRRKDSAAGFALALFNRLELTFPPENLFMDVEVGIKAGQDFEREVSACDVMLVLIGPDWLTTSDEGGRVSKIPRTLFASRSLKLWEVATGKEIPTFTGHTNDLPEVPSSHLAQREDWRRVTVARSVVECEMGDFG